MKRLLLSALAVATLGASALHAQTRLSLYEEFSGENCGPCAMYNPGLFTLLSANTSKIMLIKYQCPIPTAGPIYLAYPTFTNARLAYYNVPSAPYGVQNGNEVTGNIANYKQANIDASVAAADSFNMTSAYVYNAASDSITATVSIIAPYGYATAGANLKLRAALVEHLSYCTPPGTNGETEFHNVVREMYPDAAGTTIPNSWSMGGSQTITLKGRVPQRVDKSNANVVLVVWIQNDANKHVEQAAKSSHVTLTNDAALTGCGSAVLSCTTSGTAQSAATATLQNTGTTTITSATIYYKLDNGTYNAMPWTGSLAAGTSTAVTLPMLTVSTGNHVVYDSVGMINGSADINTANNKQVISVTVRNSTPVTLPVASDFETGVPATWTLYDATGSGSNWSLSNGYGFNNSGYSLKYAFYDIPSGAIAYAILPNTTLPAGNKALDFWIADAQYDNTLQDKLEVVYSSDCGASWNSVWSAQGANLATAATRTTAYTPGVDDWQLRSVDMSSVPTGAMVAFRATSDYGNNLYIDNVNLRAGTPTGIRATAAASGITLSPNPAQTKATLSFSLSSKERVTVSVLDATGRTVLNVTDATLAAGAQSMSITTSGLSAGVYSVVIRTAEGATAQRLSVVR